MAYKNQNYMTNRKIKELVDKNQKGYQEDEEVEEITITAKFNVIYNSEPYQGATITIGELSKTTDKDGNAIFENLPNEEATAKIISDDFPEITKNIVKDESEQIFNINTISVQVTGPTLEETEESEF